MPAWLLLGLVCGVGALGGLVNGCLNDKGFILPRSVKRPDGSGIILLGGFGNVFAGAIAATISWALSGSASQTALGAALGPSVMTIGTLLGAFGVGMAGTGWLLNFVNKNVSQLVSSQAAAAPASAEAAQKLLTSSPLQALNIVEDMKSATQLSALSDKPVGTA